MSSFSGAERTPLTKAQRGTVSDVLAARKLLGQKSLSFEFFPPREGSEESLWQTFDKIMGLNADFVSVTYGAGGSNQDKSLAVLEHMASEVLTIGHLTCVGASRASTAIAVKNFEQAGVRSILALRGDSPKDQPNALAQGELKTALEVVDLVHEITSLEVGVAAFPEGHPESPDLFHDSKVLSLKQQAGAKYAITQLFFGANHYRRMVDLAAQAGSTMPIIPGLMPVSNAKQLLRMAAMSGAAVPDFLAEKLSTADEATARKIGMDFTIQLGQELLAQGAPGLHIFTLNKAEAAIELAVGVGLV
jgi:methylenetetrahydrofolate reductase (NADPH)